MDTDRVASGEDFVQISKSDVQITGGSLIPVGIIGQHLAVKPLEQLCQGHADIAKAKNPYFFSDQLMADILFPYPRGHGFSVQHNLTSGGQHHHQRHLGHSGLIRACGPGHGQSVGRGIR